MYKTLQRLCLFTILLSTITACSLDETGANCNVTGKVTGLNGSPLEGVTVILKVPNSSQESRTDALGQFHFDNLPPGFGVLEFSKDEYFTVTQGLTFQNGNTLSVEQILRTIVIEPEEAYLNISTTTPIVHNNDTKVYIGVSSNVPYSLTCDADWVKLPQGSTLQTGSIPLDIELNEGNTERTAIIIATGLYGLRKEVTITQQAGPILRITAIENLSDKAKAIKEGLFIHYSRTVEIAGFTSKGTIANPQVTLSADGLKVHVDRLSPHPLQEATFTIKVKADNGMELSETITLTPYEAFMPYENGYNIYDMQLTDQDEYCWITAYSAPWQITKLPDLQTNIFVPDYHVYDRFAYNPYNNYVYAPRRRPTGTVSLDVLQPSNGAWIKEIPLPAITESVYGLTFADNGIGIIQAESQTYSINTAQKDKLEVLPYHLSYQYTIKPGNNGKGFIVSGENTELSVFYVDASTLVRRQITPNEEFIRCLPAYRTPQVALTTQDYSKVKLIDYQAQSERVYSMPGLYAQAFPIENEQGISYIMFASDEQVSFMRCSDGSIKDLSLSNEPSSIRITQSATDKYLVWGIRYPSGFRFLVFRTDVIQSIISALP